MELQIGENIRRLRKVIGMTQEELAERLCVSFQAVSKWERGDGLPDITILPAISCCFQVSVDELLGMDKIRSQSVLDEYSRRWSDNNKNGRNDENIGLMKEALQIFPNDALLLVQLSSSLEKAGATLEVKNANLRESIAVQERILRLGDSEVRSAVSYNICYSYLKNGERGKAAAQAEKLPNIYKTRENALIALVDGAEQLRISDEAYPKIAWVLWHHLYTSAGNESLPAVERIACLNKIKDIFRILFDGRYTEYLQNLLDKTEARLSECDR